MSAVQGSAEERHQALRERLQEGLQRIAFFVVPCVAAFVALGHVVAGGVFQTGVFSADDTRYVWAILAGSGVGLLAATLSRLTSSAFYALGDTRTPLRFAAVRVALTTALGFAAAVPLPHLLGVAPRWGAVGLTATAGLAAWIEFLLLRGRLASRIGEARVAAGYVLRLWVAALAASGVGWVVWLAARRLGPAPAAVAVLVPFAAVYGALTLALGVPAARALVGRLRDE
jgi:putative peptidoglycan lipid II flippase